MAQRPPSCDQKKASACRGVVLFEDEASFWLDGTLHRTWSPVGVQPRVDTYGARKTAHVFGAVALDNARSFFQFADVFNGKTFRLYLEWLLKHYPRRKVFLVIDNGPCHNLDEDGVVWLRANRHRIELYRLPPYSPEFNPVEGVWKATRRLTTHNRFYKTTWSRDIALSYTFARFHHDPSLIQAHVERFR